MQSGHLCANCETSFSPSPSPMARGQRFCSKACRDAANLTIKNATYRARATPHEYRCEECARDFTVVAVTHRLAGPRRRRFCSHQCKTRNAFRKKYAAGGGRRHGRVAGRARLAVFERYNWRCQPCGAVIDANLKFPAPGSPTVDHITPLADGGPHEPSNWQPAHLVCNVDKGNLDRKRKVA